MDELPARAISADLRMSRPSVDTTSSHRRWRMGEKQPAITTDMCTPTHWFLDVIAVNVSSPWIKGQLAMRLGTTKHRTAAKLALKE